jgi:hypothetical protein
MIMGSKLLPDDIAAKIPPLYSQEKKGEDATAFVKFNCVNGWVWYLTEYDPGDRMFYGLVIGDFTELGYSSLDEFESVGNLMWRDKSFVPKPLKDCRLLH